MSVPVSHVEESLKLTADAFVDLFKINLKNSATFVYFTNRPTVTWQGNEYSFCGCKLDGDQQNSDGQETRPSLTILNPKGVFSSFIKDGLLDLATVTRRRVLLTHLEANLPIYQQRLWYVSSINNVISGQSFTLSLRNMSEGPSFWVPARAYYPPEFPSVSL